VFLLEEPFNPVITNIMHRTDIKLKFVLCLIKYHPVKTYEDLRYKSKDKHVWNGTEVTHHGRFPCSASSELQSLCYLVVTLNNCVLVTHLLLNLINNVQRGLKLM
jgi:hypothetical protein